MIRGFNPNQGKKKMSQEYSDYQHSKFDREELKHSFKSVKGMELRFHMKVVAVILIYISLDHWPKIFGRFCVRFCCFSYCCKLLLVVVTCFIVVSGIQMITRQSLLGGLLFLLIGENHLSNVTVLYVPCFWEVFFDLELASLFTSLPIVFSWDDFCCSWELLTFWMGK